MERSFRVIFVWDHYFWIACWQLLSTQTHPTQGLALSADVEVAHRGSAEGKDAHTGFPALIFKPIWLCVYNTCNASSLKPATAHPKNWKQFVTIFLIIPVVTLCRTSHAPWYTPPWRHSWSRTSSSLKSAGAFSGCQPGWCKDSWQQCSRSSGKAVRPKGYENSSLSPQRSDCWVAFTFCLPTQGLLRWAQLQQEHTFSRLFKAACLQQAWLRNEACKSTVWVRCWFIPRFLNGSLCLRAPPYLDLGSFWVGSLCCQLFAAEWGGKAGVRDCKTDFSR